jgi:hypothetical protein
MVTEFVHTMLVPVPWQTLYVYVPDTLLSV